MGAWIEIQNFFSDSAALSSLPTWERGLKSLLGGTFVSHIYCRSASVPGPFAKQQVSPNTIVGVLNISFGYNDLLPLLNRVR